MFLSVQSALRIPIVPVTGISRSTQDSVARAARYRIARTRNWNEDDVVLGETTAITYANTSAENGTSYQYQITPFQDLDPAHQGETSFSPFGERP